MKYIVVNNTKDRAWYAMKASYGKALKAKAELDALNIESYVPICYQKEKVKGRNHVKAVAAIPNLIFISADNICLENIKIKFDYLHHMLVKSMERDDVLEPIIVPDLDMERFIKVVADAQADVKFVDLAINDQIISKGTKVRIIDGEYDGYEGVLCRPKGSRAKKVLIDICGLAMVEIPAVNVELLEEI